LNIENEISDKPGKGNGKTANPGKENNSIDKPGKNNNKAEKPGKENDDSDKAGKEKNEKVNPSKENNSSDKPGKGNDKKVNPGKENDRGRQGDSYIVPLSHLHLLQLLVLTRYWIHTIGLNKIVRGSYENTAAEYIKDCRRVCCNDNRRRFCVRPGNNKVFYAL
ncbi:MAG TPA: hypothetical protein VIL89_05570, partial [Clostridia bacterium]